MVNTPIKSEWKFLFNLNNYVDKVIYDKLADSMILPGTSIVVNKMFVKDNVGIRKITLKVDKLALKGTNCEINIQYQRSE